MTGSEKPNIPFFGNYNDKSCAQCVYRMVLASFFSERERTRDEMDAFCGAVPGKYTWHFQPILNMADLNLDLVIYNTFDTKKFLESPEDYLIERYGPEGGENQIKNSDMPSVLSQAQMFMDYKDHKKLLWICDDHTPKIVKDFLDKGFLVAPWVNLRKLNNKEGIFGHIILVHGYEDGYFIAHDPGENDAEGNPLNQIENRRISEDEFLEICCPKDHGKTNFLIAMRKPSFGGHR